LNGDAAGAELPSGFTGVFAEVNGVAGLLGYIDNIRVIRSQPADIRLIGGGGIVDGDA